MSDQPPSTRAYESALWGASARRVKTMCLAALVLCVPAALAQVAPARRAPAAPPEVASRLGADVLRVDWGWDNTMPSERWAPVVVWMYSGGRAFSGTATLSYRQDATQHQTVTVPVATTPGQVVPFELVASVPAQVNTFGPMDAGMTLTIREADSGRSARYTFAAVPARSSDLPAPELTPYGLLAVVVGAESASAAFGRNALRAEDLEVTTDAAPTDTPDDPLWIGGTSVPRDLWARFRAASVEPTGMPMAWLAYDGAQAVVADADALAKADPRAQQALMTWVEAGGRLVLLIDAAGGWWRQFLPDGEPVALADDQATVSPMAGRVRVSGADLATTLKARVLRVTPAGKRLGWLAYWPVEGEPLEEAGLVARGPMGLGMVTLLGVDPARMPRIVSTSATGQVWREVLAGPEFGAIPLHARAIDERAQNWYWMGSGSDFAASNAMRALLDASVQAPPVSDLVFVIIAGSMVLLAGMMGLFDYLFLKRRGLSRRSWMTASIWIGLAAAAALIAPAVVRSGVTRVCRADVRDVFQGPTPRVWTTGLSGVFADAPLVSSITPRAGSFWRGVSPLAGYSAEGRMFTPLNAGVMLDPPRAVAMSPFRQGQWTFRTLLEQRPGEPARGALPVRAEIARSEDRWHVVLSGVPDGAVVREALLRVPDGYGVVSIRGATGEDGSTRHAGEIEAVRLTEAVPNDWTPDAARDDWYGTPGGGTRGAFVLGAVHVPGARERSDATEALVASGCWAMLVVRIDGMPDDSGLTMPVETTRSSITILRILVPIEGRETTEASVQP